LNDRQRSFGFINKKGENDNMKKQILIMDKYDKSKMWLLSIYDNNVKYKNTTYCYKRYFLNQLKNNIKQYPKPKSYKLEYLNNMLEMDIKQLLTNEEIETMLQSENDTTSHTFKYAGINYIYDFDKWVVKAS
jgi:hypothetical protein